MDEQPIYPEGEETQDEERPNRGALIVRALIWFPLVMCAILSLVVYAALPAAPAIPVTGDPLRAPTQTPAAAGSPTPAPVLPAAPGISYKEEARLRLDACNAAFHEIFLIEQAALHTPGLLEDDWRDTADRAMSAFQAHCEPLGAMPEAPAAYQGVDQWLKLAAGEIAPAVASFSEAIEKDEAAVRRKAIGHLMRFVAYTHKAEELIERIDRRKQA